MFASNPIGINTETINGLVEKYANNEFVECDYRLITKLLKLIPSKSIEDFDTKKFVSCVESIPQSRPTIKCKLIVRINRDITKGTGTLLSPNDRDLGEKYPKDIILTLYRIKGEKKKGWDDKPIWIPNIKFPNDCIFYDVK